MGYTTTYDDLVIELQNYCEDDTAELGAAIPKIVQRAEDRVRSDLNLPDMVGYRTFVLDLGTNETIITSAFAPLRIDGCYRTNGLPLQRRHVDFVRTYASTADPGVPLYWAYAYLTTTATGNSFALDFAPTADAAYNLYTKESFIPDSLSPSNTMNWISQRCGDLLFFAALAEAEAFLQAPERIQEFKENYGSLLASRRQEITGSNLAFASPPAAPAVQPAG